MGKVGRAGRGRAEAVVADVVGEGDGWQVVGDWWDEAERVGGWRGMTFH